MKHKATTSFNLATALGALLLFAPLLVAQSPQTYQGRGRCVLGPGSKTPVEKGRSVLSTNSSLSTFPGAITTLCSALITTTWPSDGITIQPTTPLGVSASYGGADIRGKLNTAPPQLFTSVM